MNDEVLINQLNQNFDKLPESCREEMYNKLKSISGALYHCEEPKCDKKWRSNQLEPKCKFCSSHRITLLFEKRIKCGKYELNGINFFHQED